MLQVMELECHIASHLLYSTFHSYLNMIVLITLTKNMITKNSLNLFPVFFVHKIDFTRDVLIKFFYKSLGILPYDYVLPAVYKFGFIYFILFI